MCVVIIIGGQKNVLGDRYLSISGLPERFPGLYVETVCSLWCIRKVPRWQSPRSCYSVSFCIWSPSAFEKTLQMAEFISGLPNFWTNDLCRIIFSSPVPQVVCDVENLFVIEYLKVVRPLCFKRINLCLVIERKSYFLNILHGYLIY